MQTLEIFGKPDCVDFARSRALLKLLEVPFTFHDIIADERAAAEALRISGGASSPVIVFPDGSHLVEPSDPVLAAKLGRSVATAPENDSCEVAGSAE